MKATCDLVNCRLVCAYQVKLPGLIPGHVEIFPTWPFSCNVTVVNFSCVQFQTFSTNSASTTQFLRSSFHFVWPRSGSNSKVSESMPTRLFSFMNPLAVEIWLYVLAAYVLVSLTIWVVARFSPYEWCVPACTCADYQHAAAALLVFQNDFTLANSFWFTIGTLMQQGSDLNPKVP